MAESTRRLKYLQLSGILRERIERGVYPIGERIPSYPQLVTTFKVSEITVRRAVSILAEEGLLRMEPGRSKGFFVQSRTGRLAHRSPIRQLGITGSSGLQSDDPAIQNGVLSVLDPDEVSMRLLPQVRGGDRKGYFEKMLERPNPPDALLINAHFFDSEADLTDTDAMLRQRKVPHVMFFPAESGLEKNFRKSGRGGVFINERKALEEALETALASGHDKLLFTGVANTSVDRCRAVASRLKILEKFSCEKHILDSGGDLFKSTLGMLDSVDLNRTTIVLEGSNLPLCYFDSALRSRKLTAGKQVSVFFFEHYCNLEPVFFRRYSSVSRPFFEIGRCAGKLLEQRWQDPGENGSIILDAAFNSLGTI